MAAASLEDRELRQRLLQRDPIAPAEPFERFIVPVSRAVAARVVRPYTSDVAYDKAVAEPVNLVETAFAGN
ncbi:MAG TPA: hypothetical protein VKV26_13585 [Dehalococcoidia bacterium]|nr:hypothetical protein [Dehalococcoidia bacterium]